MNVLCTAVLWFTKEVLFSWCWKLFFVHRDVFSAWLHIILQVFFSFSFARLGGSRESLWLNAVPYLLYSLSFWRICRDISMCAYLFRVHQIPYFFVFFFFFFIHWFNPLLIVRGRKKTHASAYNFLLLENIEVVLWTCNLKLTMDSRRFIHWICIYIFFFGFS